MDKKQHNQQQNSLGGGFLLGLVLGVLVTLLFSTKRGRELLKEWTEKGITKLSDLETIIKQQTEQSAKQPEKSETDYIQKDQKQKEQERKLIAQEAEVIEEKPVPQTPKKEEQKPLTESPKGTPKHESEINPDWKPVEPPIEPRTKPIEIKKEEPVAHEKLDKKETKEEKPTKSPMKRFFKRK